VKRRKTLAATITLLSIALSIYTAGCSGARQEPVVTLDGKSIYLEDFLYDIYLVEADGSQLEKDYQANFNCSYWDSTHNGMTLREAAKNSVLASVVMYEILADQAEKNGVQLSDEELNETAATVNSIQSSSWKESLDKAGLTSDVLKKACEMHALGDKYRTQLTKDIYIDENAIRDSIDPEDYREYITECLFIPTVLLEDNTVSPLSEGEKASARRLAQKVHNKLSSGTGFDRLLNQYSSLQYYNRNFVYGDTNVEAEYQEAAMLLGKDGYSPLVATDYGYYIIHMIDNNSTTRYEQALEAAVAAEEDKQFAALYDRIKDSYNITINFDYWDTIRIGSITVPQ